MLDIFTPADWKRIQTDYEGWWNHTSDKPVLNLSFDGKEPGMQKPEGMITDMTFRYSPSESAESVAEKCEYMMRGLRYEMDGYPHTWLNLGPLFDVDFFGIKAHIAETTVWFSPDKRLPARELHFAVDPDSVFLARYKALVKAIDDRFQGGYVVSSAPCGGGHCLDALCEYYGHDGVSYLLYDEPEEVDRLCMEYHDISLALGEEIKKLTPRATGFTSWGGIYAPEHWVGMQSDYCAMIGREHFERFVKWNLELTARENPRYNYYHLDGPGEIIHLDSILTIPHLQCVQYVAAPHGDPSVDLGVYERVFKAGRNMWVTGPIEMAQRAAERNGTGKGIYWYGVYGMKDYDRVMKIAEDLMK